jgi:hypothetical protein
MAPGVQFETLLLGPETSGGTFYTRTRDAQPTWLAFDIGPGGSISNGRPSTDPTSTTHRSGAPRL